MDIHTWSNLPYRGDKVGVGVKRVTGVNPGEEADLGDVATHRRTGLLPHGRDVIAERPRIISPPPEPTEPAEVLADVGDVDILVPDVGDGIADFAFTEFVRGGGDIPDIPAAGCEQPHRLLLGEAVAGERVVEQVMQ